MLFAELSEWAVQHFHNLADALWWSPLIVCPLGGALVVWATRRWFPGAEGGGIQQTVAAIHCAKRHQIVEQPLLSLRIVFGKITLATAALFSGFSMGREAPTVQIGAAMMNALHPYLPGRLHIGRHHLIAAGGAAGIAAAFNTPLAGIMFAIEELHRGFEQRMSGMLIIAVVLSGVVARAFLGDTNYFGWVSYTGLKDLSQYLWVLFIAILCGLAGGAFARLMILITARDTPILGPLRTARPMLFAAGCGFLLALVGIFSDNTAFGTGYTEARNLFESDAELPWHYGIDKFAATLLSYASGVPGGILAPSISIGAGLGSNLALLLGDQISSGTVLVLCAAGFLAAVTQTPITAFVIVMEMVSGYGVIIDLMIVSLLASVVSRAFCPPLYRTLAQRITGQTRR